MDTMSEKSLRITIVCLCLLLLYSVFSLTKEASKNDHLSLEIQSMQIKLDSLHDENFSNEVDRKSTRLNSSHVSESRMPSSA